MFTTAPPPPPPKKGVGSIFNILHQFNRVGDSISIGIYKKHERGNELQLNCETQVHVQIRYCTFYAPVANMYSHFTLHGIEISLSAGPLYTYTTLSVMFFL